MDTPCSAQKKPVFYHRFSVVFRLSRHSRTLPHSAAHIICALSVALTRTLHVHSRARLCAAQCRYPVLL
jgi:hypothetical protein